VPSFINPFQVPVTFVLDGTPGGAVAFGTGLPSGSCFAWESLSVWHGALLAPAGIDIGFVDSHAVAVYFFSEQFGVSANSASRDYGRPFIQTPQFDLIYNASDSGFRIVCTGWQVPDPSTLPA
jgi:hypothetical protein